MKAHDRLAYELSDLLTRIGQKCAMLAEAAWADPPPVYVAARLVLGMQTVSYDLEAIDLKGWAE